MRRLRAGRFLTIFYINITICAPWRFSPYFLQECVRLESSEQTHTEQNICNPIYSPSKIIRETDKSTFIDLTAILSNKISPDRALEDDYLWLSAKNANKVVNITAVAYALISMYKAHEKLYLTPTGAPINPGITHYYTFLKDCLQSGCKALAYKTVAQLIILCADGNILDLIGYGLQKVGHLVF